MPRTEYDTLLLRYPKTYGYRPVLESVAARHKARGNRNLDSQTAIGTVILDTFLKTAAACRANPEIDVYKMMGANFAKLYTELFREDQPDAQAL